MKNGTASCTTCGVTYRRRSGDAGLYCSRACWIAAIPRAKARACRICLVQFTPKRNLSNPRLGVYCSRKCLAQVPERQISLHEFVERFHASVDREAPDACWPWRARRDSKGYGMAKFRQRNFIASRVAWVLSSGSIDPELNVCHRCDNPACCNPAHLFLGTQRQNIRDAVAKKRLVHGAKHYIAKLTDDAVRAIRDSHETCATLAKRFGVAPRTAREARAGITWKHIACRKEVV